MLSRYGWLNDGRDIAASMKINIINLISPTTIGERSNQSSWQPPPASRAWSHRTIQPAMPEGRR
jgi:hypothetical protein